MLHQYGAKNHYLGLKHWCGFNDKAIIWLELDLFRQLILFFLGKKPFAHFKKNFIGILSILFGRNKSDDLVLGIAPFSYYIVILPFLNVRNMYLHTSWPHWDGNFVPFPSVIFSKLWDKILPKSIKGVFCVTVHCKNSFIKRYSSLKDKVFVVHHAIEDFWFEREHIFKKEYDFVYVGRMVEEKGLNKVIELAQKMQNHVFALVGDGPDLKRLLSIAPKNVVFLGKLNRHELKRIYHSSSCLLLPSLKSHNWVEAFGIVIVEAVACDCSVMSTNHPGPSELSKILSNVKVFAEDEFVSSVSELFAHELKYKYIDTKVKMFTIEQISKKWSQGLILND